MEAPFTLNNTWAEQAEMWWISRPKPTIAEDSRVGHVRKSIC